MSRVRLYVWRVPAASVPALIWRVRQARRRPGVEFAKLLGTSRDRRFGPGSVDPTRWAAIVVASADPRFVASKDPNGLPDGCRLELEPIASRGRWSGREPFATVADTTDGMVLALTRARLRPSRVMRFWRASRTPALAAERAPGLLAAFGVGEAPIGWQGTVSLWRSQEDLVEFAYRHPDHRGVVERTPAERWYAEELFARFAVVRVTGDRGVIGWTDSDPDWRSA